MIKQYEDSEFLPSYRERIRIFEHELEFLISQKQLKL